MGFWACFAQHTRPTEPTDYFCPIIAAQTKRTTLAYDLIRLCSFLFVCCVFFSSSVRLSTFPIVSLIVRYENISCFGRTHTANLNQKCEIERYNDNREEKSNENHKR